jgi:transposase
MATTTEIDRRLERGKAIAAGGRLRPIGDGTWAVLSQTGAKKKYLVDPEKQTCTCPDFEAWELPCKHIYAVRLAQNPQFSKENPSKCKESDTMRPTYQQDWPSYNAAQIHEREHFEKLLKDLCHGIPEPPQKKGRPRLTLSDMVYSATTKVYTGFSGRRASTDIHECQDHGHIDHAPHHNSISRYLGMKELTPILKHLIEVSALPLKAVETQFAIDSTGFSTCVYDRWFDHKYGTAESGRRQRWIKCHAMVGTLTNVVTAVEVSESYVSDTNQLPELLSRTAANFDTQEISADKAYLSNVNLTVIEMFGAKPFVPFKVDSKGSGMPAWERMWHQFWFMRDKFMTHYHRRSNVESTFSALKRKLGGSVRSKDVIAQYNEVLCKVLAYNITVVIHEMYELGIDPGFENLAGTGTH